MRTFTLFVLTVICYFPVIAQKQCGTELYQERIRKEFPQSLSQEGIHMEMSAVGTASSTELSSQQVITIPVVVHVLYSNDGNNIPDAKIMEQLDILNRDFNKGNDDISKVPAAFSAFVGGANIQFKLAKVDPDGKATTGITRKRSAREFWANDDKVKDPSYGGVAPWDSRYYLNIWVCNLVPGLLGYSSAPGSPANKDGVVIKYSVFGIGSGSFNRGRTAVHEIGHWLNLKHLWGEVECGSDDVDDTPQQRTYNQGCPSFPRINTTCGASNPNGEMFMNFMDFTNDDCMMMFTNGQVGRMRSLFATGAARNSILSSRALGEPYAGTGVTPTPATPSTTVSQPVRISISLNLYPNPAVNEITINSKETNLFGKMYEVFTAAGRRVMAGKFNGENQKISVDQFRPGIYFIRVENVPQVARFIKQ